jgi:SAM-dependent methyltransferase
VANSVAGFYDGLAAEYHLLFADWDASVRRQGEILDRLIGGQLAQQEPKRVLDCSCGIGTQAIGLALRGHRVHGTDLSPAAVERAQREAARLGATLTTEVADLRDLGALDVRDGTFDVVLSCDNAVPHLLTDEDLSRAAAGMYAKLRPDGLLVVSMRDYDQIIAEKPRYPACSIARTAARSRSRSGIGTPPRRRTRCTSTSCGSGLLVGRRTMRPRSTGRYGGTSGPGSCKLLASAR